MPRRKAATRLSEKKSSDSDSIDLESTEISEVDEGKDYVVECILAEYEDVEGKMFYLLKWEDYPMLRSTWEPTENIKDQFTFDEWKTQKERIDKGLAKPFDVVKFGEELDQEGKAKALRHNRRERKRKRFGLPKSFSALEAESVRPKPEEIDSDSSSEAQEVNEDLQNPPSVPARAQRYSQRPTTNRTAASEDIDTEDALQMEDRFTGSRPRRRHNIPDEDIDISDDSLVEELGKQLKERKALGKARPVVRRIPEKKSGIVSNESESMSSRDASPRRPPQDTKQRRKILGAEVPSRTGYLGTANRDVNIPNTTSRARGAAATRGSYRGRGVWRNVRGDLNFTTGQVGSTEASQRPRGLANAILNAAKADSNKSKQHFTTPSMVRKAELASRGLADRAPDIAFIGPLIKPSEYNISLLKKKSISSKLDSPRKYSDSMQGVLGAQSNRVRSGKEADSIQPNVDTEEVATQGGVVAHDMQMRELPSWTPRGPSSMVNDQAQAINAVSVLASINSGNPEKFRTTSSNSTGNSTAASQQIFQPPKPVTKVSFSEYVNRRVLEHFGDAISIQAIFGDNKAPPIIIAFRGTNKNDQEPWIHSLGGLETALFTRSCVAQDFQTQISYSQSQVLASGDIATDNDGSQVTKRIAECLRPLLGLVLNHKLFSILIYPAKCEEWKFIDPNANNGSENPLLYRIFQGLIHFTGETLNEAVEGSPSMIDLDQNYLESLLNVTQSLQYGRLIPIQAEPNKSHSFYLVFPNRVSSTIKLLATWLRACDPDCRIYTNQKPGSWDFFINNPHFNVGTVLIHQSLLSLISKIPRLAEMMDIKRQYFFWCFGDSPSASLINMSLGYPMVRLFPHGGAIFLTPSFLKSQPKRTYEFLIWFQEKLTRTTPGTWKLVVSHNCCDFLLNLALKAAIVDENPVENPLEEPTSAASNRPIHRKGKFEFLNYQILDKLMRQELMAGYPLDWDRSTPDDAECSMVYADESLDPEDEIGLATWFALWSMLHLHLFRKFIVVGTALSRIRSKTPAIEEPFGFKTREEIPRTDKASATKQKNNQSQPIEIHAITNNANVPQLPAKGWKRSAFAEIKEFINSPPNTHANDKTLSQTTPNTNMSNPIDKNIDESILHFIVITGADKATASHWVERFNNDAIIAAKHYAREQQGNMQVDGAEDDADASAILNFAGTYEPGPDAPIIPSIASEDLLRAMEIYQIGKKRSPPYSGRPSNYDGPDDTDAMPRHRPSSRSGPRTGEVRIRKLVPHSNRLSGTTQPEINVRPGHIPSEDAQVYRNSRNVGGFPPHEHNGASSERGSKHNSSAQSYVDGIADASRPSALDTEDLSASTEECRERRRHSAPEKEMTISELDEPQTPIAQELDNGETTMEWYGRMCKEGKSWEHIYVKDWGTCFKVLGIHVTGKQISAQK